MVPQPFATRGNYPYLEFWAVTGGLGYFTPIVALELSVEQAEKASSRRDAEYVLIYYYGHFHGIQ
jgi:hypothetical protein